jgi:hypothetical protein
MSTSPTAAFAFSPPASASGRGANAAQAFASFRRAQDEADAHRPVQVGTYWAKCAGLYPSYDAMDAALAQHNAMAYAEYSTFAHDYMVRVFEAKCDDEALLKEAAHVIGEKGGVQAMLGVIYGFRHGMGVAYATSGWEDGRAASIAMGDARVKILQAWDGVHGFSPSFM